jgi:hypothetical protein
LVSSLNLALETGPQGRRKIEKAPPPIQGPPVRELKFYPWDQPLLPVVAAELVRWYETAETADLSSLIVVLPGARAGRRLLELLLQEASARHRRLHPPARILTVGSLPEILYRSARPLASPVLVRRAWGRALAEASAPVLEAALGPGLRRPGGRDDPGLPRLLDRLHRTVGAAGRDFESVADECRRGFLFSDSNRWRALARLQVRMREALEAGGLMDREQARVQALAEGRVTQPGSLVLVSLAELPLVTHRMLERLEGEVRILVHAPGTEAHAFDALGTLRTEAWQERSVPIQDSHLAVVNGPVEQARMVRGWISSLPGTYGAQDITVGVPDPSLVPYITRELETHGVPTRYAEGTPLSLAPPVQLLATLAEYLEEGRFSTLADLLRHPDLPVTAKPEWAPERADRYFQRHLPHKLEKEVLGDGQARMDMVGIRDALNQMVPSDSFAGEASLSTWMPPILGFLEGVYGRLAPDPDPEHFRVVLEASVLIRESAESLHRLPPELDEDCTAPQAIRVLMSELREGQIPPERVESAVELVGWLELQLDDAPAVVLTGVSDPFLPESVNADPFLPNTLRSRLGLEDNQARYARDVYRLTTLMASTQARLLVAGARDASGDPLRPSRLLLTGSDEEVARRVLELSPEKPLEEGPPEQGAGESGVMESFPREVPASGRGFALPPEEFIPVDELPQPFPVTAFRALLDDPYLWALQGVLKLEDTDYDLHELDPMGFGILAHEVLEEFARGPAASAREAPIVSRSLGEILDDRARRRFGNHPLPAVLLQVEQLRARLARFSVWQAGWMASGWEILHVEARTPQVGVPFDVDGDPVFLSGRIDRIDRHSETGEWRVFDIKTGEKAPQVRSVRLRDGQWRDLQLPLYRWLLKELQGGGGENLDLPPADTAVSLGYLPLPKGDAPVEPDVASWTPEILETAYEAAREAIRRLRLEGGVHFRPQETGKGARGRFAALLGMGLLLPGEGSDEGDEA